MKKYLNNKYFLLFLILPLFNPTAFKYIPSLVLLYDLVQCWKLLAILLIIFIYLYRFRISKIIFAIIIFELLAIFMSLINGVLAIQPITNAGMALGMAMLIEMALKSNFNVFRKVYFGVALVMVLLNLIVCFIYPQGLPMATLYTNRENPLYLINIDNGLIKSLLPLLVLGYCPCFEKGASVKKRNSTKIVFLLCCAISLLTLYIAGSATGLIVCAFFVVCALLFLFMPKKRFPVKTMLCLITLFMLFIVIFGNEFKIIDTLMGLIGRSGTFTGRASLWNSALQKILKKPIFGYGYTSGNIEIWGGYFSSHNLFLELTIQGGLPLLVMFLYVSWIAFHSLRKANAAYFNVISIGLICYLIVGLMETGVNEFYFALTAFAYHFAEKSRKKIPVHQAPVPSGSASQQLQLRTKKKSISKNAVLNAIKSLMAIIFPLITFPYISSILGVEVLGKYNFAFSVNSYFLMFAALGISTYAVREGAALRNDRKKLSEFSSEVYTINLYSTLVAYVLLGIGIGAIYKFRDYYELLLVFSVEILFTTLGVEWLFIIYEEYFYITVRRIAFQLISLVLMFLLVKSESDVIIYAAVTVLANAGANLLNITKRRQYADIRPRKSINLKKHIKPILIIFASTLAIKVYTSSDVIMLGFLTDDYYVGLYSVSIKVYNVVKPLLTAVMVVAIPRLVAYLSEKKTDRYKSLLTKIFNALNMIVLPSAVGIAMISDKIILLLSNSSYLEADLSLKLLSIAIVFSTFSAFYNQCVMIPLKLEKQFLIATVVSACVNVALNFALIPFLKQDGAAAATVVAEFVSMGMCYLYSRKKAKMGGIWGNLISVLVACMGIAGVCIGLSFVHITTGSARLSNILEIVIVCSVSVVAYGVILLLFRNKLLMGMIRKILPHKKEKTENEEQ